MPQARGGNVDLLYSLLCCCTHDQEFFCSSDRDRVTSVLRTINNTDYNLCIPRSYPTLCVVCCVDESNHLILLQANTTPDSAAPVHYRLPAQGTQATEFCRVTIWKRANDGVSEMHMTLVGVTQVLYVDEGAMF
jgi:hypothetical protein